MDYAYNNTELAACQVKSSPLSKSAVVQFSQMTMLDFWDWVDQEIQARNLSYYRIEQDAGLANAAVSRPARQRSQPTLTVCNAIAQAFDMQDVDVLRKAGLIDPVPAAVAREEEVIRLFRQVPDTHRDLAIRVLDVFAHAAPAPGANPNEWANLAPGESVILRTWGADHPLIQLFESLRTASGEEAVAWLLEHVMRFGTTAATETEEERKSPAIESARR